MSSGGVPRVILLIAFFCIELINAESVVSMSCSKSSSVEIASSLEYMESIADWDVSTRCATVVLVMVSVEKVVLG